MAKKDTLYEETSDYSPWAVIAPGWVLLLVFVLLASHRMHADAVAELEMGQENSWQVQAYAPFASVSQGLGLSAAADAVSDLRATIYDTEVRVAGVAGPEPVWDEPLTVASAPAPGAVEPGTAALALGDGGADDLADPVPPPPVLHRPTRVLIVGASSVQFALGNALEDDFDAFPNMEVHRFGRHSTGLSRPDYYDWIERGEELRREFRPDLVVAQFGGNDCQGLANHAGRGIGRFGTEDWDQGYYDRVQAFAALYSRHDIPVVVLGMPIMRSPRFRGRMTHLNEITELAVAEYDQGEGAPVYFVSTHEMVMGPDGGYMEYAEIDGRRRKIRADDGTHLTRFGAEIVSSAILDQLDQLFALPQRRGT